jgi:PilZ domain
MSEMMSDLSIDVDLCMMPSRAFELLAKRDVDLLVIDYENENGASELVKSLGNLVARKMTVAALVDSPSLGEKVRQAGVHALVPKPLTSQCKTDFRYQVYSRMIHEWREQPRYGVNWLVAATDASDRPVPVRMIDISEKGVGLLFTGKLPVGEVLRFKVLLPGTNQIVRFDARVLWTLGNRAGADFVNISSDHSAVLRQWFRSRHQVKKPDNQSATCSR